MCVILFSIDMAIRLTNEMTSGGGTHHASCRDSLGNPRRTPFNRPDVCACVYLIFVFYIGGASVFVWVEREAYRHVQVRAYFVHASAIPPCSHMYRLALRRRSCSKCSPCKRLTNSSVVVSWIGQAALMPMSGVNGHDCESSSCGGYRQ